MHRGEIRSTVRSIIIKQSISESFCPVTCEKLVVALIAFRLLTILDETGPFANLYFILPKTVSILYSDVCT